MSCGHSEAVSRPTLQTGVHRAACLADLAVHRTTPVERAAASLQFFANLGLVAAAAAHQLAPVDADRRVVADTASRARYAEFQVRVAEVGRVFEVDEVFARGRLVRRVVRLQLELGLLLEAAEVTLVGHEHPRRAVEPVLDVVADVAEHGQTHPARLHRARTGHAVALALAPHLMRHVLRCKR